MMNIYDEDPILQLDPEDKIPGYNVPFEDVIILTPDDETDDKTNKSKELVMIGD